MLSRAEAIGVSLASFPAAAILWAYLADAAGLSLHPTAVLAAALLSTLTIDRLIAGRVSRDSSRGASVVFVGVAGLVAIYLFWLAWPALLPIGGGSDLTHHLMLIDFIERTGRSVHDHALAAQLGEMVDYTPGAHLLAALLGRRFHVDGLHAMYPIVAITVALKAGFIFLITLRCTADRSTSRLPLALVAVLLLFVPQTFFLGSFAHDSFFSQVVSELFAMAMWWAAICWNEKPSRLAASLVGIFGAVAFVTWPVFVATPLVAFAIMFLRRHDVRDHLKIDAALALIPLAVVTTIHVAGHFHALRIAATSGAAPTPTLDQIGWLFPMLGIAGLVVAARSARARSVVLLSAAIALQAAALFLLANARGATTPYLALKMFYLAIYPLAVAGAVGVGAAFDRMTRAGRLRTVLAWSVPAALAVWIGPALILTPRPRPVLSDELLGAGEWARAHVPAACVDYLTADDDGGYWLHLAVLRNPRASSRAIDPQAFDPTAATARWQLPSGLPFAIAEDFDSLPREIRDHVDVLTRVGHAAVIQRRGATATCPAGDQPVNKPTL